jgi:hypothetical protein
VQLDTHTKRLQEKTKNSSIRPQRLLTAKHLWRQLPKQLPGDSQKTQILVFIQPTAPKRACKQVKEKKGRRENN